MSSPKRITSEDAYTAIAILSEIIPLEQLGVVEILLAYVDQTEAERGGIVIIVSDENKGNRR